MTNTELKALLNSELVGKDFGKNAVDCVTIVKNELKELGLSLQYVSSDCYRNQWRVKVVTYTSCGFKEFEICNISFKKKKGESHYHYGYSWTDYTIVDVIVNLRKDTLEESYLDAIKALKGSTDSADAYKKEAAELLKQIMAITGKPGYSVSQMCDYISKHYWTLSDMIKEEEKESN